MYIHKYVYFMHTKKIVLHIYLSSLIFISLHRKAAVCRFKSTLIHHLPEGVNQRSCFMLQCMSLKTQFQKSQSAGAIHWSISLSKRQRIHTTFNTGISADYLQIYTWKPGYWDFAESHNLVIINEDTRLTRGVPSSLSAVLAYYQPSLPGSS